MSQTTQNNIRISISYQEEPKLFLFNQGSDLESLKIMVDKRFGIQSTNINFFHKIFKAKIDDTDFLKDNDEIYVVTSDHVEINRDRIPLLSRK